MHAHVFRWFALLVAVMAAFSMGCSGRRSEGQKPAVADDGSRDKAADKDSGRSKSESDVTADGEVLGATKHEVAQHEETVNGKAQRLVNQLYNYCLGICKNDECPADLDAAKKAVKEQYRINWPKDPWGKPYQYKKTGDDSCEVWSAGPDGIDGNEDDIRLEEKNRG